MNDFVSVANLSDLPDGSCKQVRVGGDAIGLYRAGDNVYALHDVCTHEHAFLTEGEFDPDELEVECPLHGSRFRVDTGEVRILPATKPEIAYEVKVDDGAILVGPRKSK